MDNNLDGGIVELGFDGLAIAFDARRERQNVAVRESRAPRG